MTTLIDEENLVRALYNALTTGDENQANALFLAVSQTTTHPTPISFLDDPDIQAAINALRVPGTRVDYPIKGDYYLQFNPREMAAGGAKAMHSGLLAEHTGAITPMNDIEFEENIISNIHSNYEISIQAQSGKRNRIRIGSAGLWMIAYNFNVGFLPPVGITGSPKAFNEFSKTSVSAGFVVRNGSSTMYTPLAKGVVDAASFEASQACRLSEQCLVTLQEGATLDFYMARGRSIGYFGDNNQNHESMALIKHLSTEPLDDPTRDYGNFVKLTRIG